MISEIRSKKINHRLLVAMISILVVVAIGYVAFFRSETKEPTFKIATVSTRSVEETVSANGKAKYREYYELSFPKGGKIISSTEEGESVRKGSVIAVLDSTFEKLAVEKARIAFETAVAETRSKKAWWTSEEEIRLYELRLGSAKSDLEMEKRTLEQNESEALKTVATTIAELAKAEESLRTAIVESERVAAENERAIRKHAELSILSLRISADLFDRQLEGADLLLGATESNRSANDAIEPYLSAKESSILPHAISQLLSARKALSDFLLECWPLDESAESTKAASCLSASQSVGGKVSAVLSETVSVLRHSIASNALSQETINAQIQRFSDDLSKSRQESVNLADLERSLSEAESSAKEVESANKQAILGAKNDIAVASARVELARSSMASVVEKGNGAIRSAEDRVVDAEATLEWKRRPVPATELAVYLRAEESARTNLEEAWARLSERTLKSPVDGVVVRADVRFGEEILGGTRVVTVADTSNPYVESDVEETDVGKVRLNQRANVRFDSKPETLFGGTVSFISPTSETDENGVVNYAVRILLDVVPFPVPEGSAASVDFVTKRSENTLTLPVSAVSKKPDGGNSVFLLDTNSEVPVTLGTSDGKIVEILSGVTLGERIRY